MDYDSLLELVKQRRSVRSFKPEPVPDELIGKMIEVARWAPSGANTQPWEFIVVTEKETKRKIAGILDEHGALGYKMELTRNPSRPAPPPFDFDSPTLIILCGDPRTIVAYPLYSVYQRGKSNLDSSLASAFLYMHLAAASLGLGSRWITATRDYYVQVLIKDLLGIPPDLEIYDTLAVGYPEGGQRQRFVRDRDDMVHYGRFDAARARTDEQVTEYLASLRR